jgi:hypothetical protein
MQVTFSRLERRLRISGSAGDDAASRVAVMGRAAARRVCSVRFWNRVPSGSGLEDPTARVRGGGHQFRLDSPAEFLEGTPTGNRTETPEPAAVAVESSAAVVGADRLCAEEDFTLADGTAAAAGRTLLDAA